MTKRRFIVRALEEYGNQQVEVLIQPLPRGTLGKSNPNEDNLMTAIATDLRQLRDLGWEVEETWLLALAQEDADANT